MPDTLTNETSDTAGDAGPLNAPDLRDTIEFAGTNPIISAVLHSVGGVLAVLDKQQRVIALNESFLHMTQTNDPIHVLGLRLGEAVSCIHASDGPEGCGSGSYCATCGAARAVIESDERGRPVEKDCEITTRHDEQQSVLDLRIRAAPLHLDDKQFTVLFLRDITVEKRRASLESIFFHDVGNIVAGLSGASELLVRGDQPDARELVDYIRHASSRLEREFRIQRALSSGADAQVPNRDTLPVDMLLQEIRSFFSQHPVSKDRTLHLDHVEPGLRICTDASLLVRALTNMLTNAFEAIAPGGTVSLWTEEDETDISFHVWNEGAMSQEEAVHVFEKDYTTKKQAGRGTGAFAIRLIGEHFLGGKVAFTTSSMEGTVFSLRLPKSSD
ncbi:MAG: PAS domain-containing sensor histidine kinase [Lentisphaerae bacterium]|nr:PAS domain-containing sensor histidine kinase [Lentisphaerota bacterium]